MGNIFIEELLCDNIQKRMLPSFFRFPKIGFTNMVFNNILMHYELFMKIKKQNRW